MLVMTAGTMTIASARDGCMVTASRPIATVGRPSPSTPLMKPASRNTAAIGTMNGSNMPETLTDRRYRHNLEVTETAFDNDEGLFYRHCEHRTNQAIHPSLVPHCIPSLPSPKT